MQRDPRALLEGYILRSRYRVGKVLGVGGFGITYLVEDEKYHRQLAMKEYYPKEWACRGLDGRQLFPRDQSKLGVYRHGLDVFFQEAKILQSLQNDQVVVNVYHFYKENNTAYLLMEYVEGDTLATLAKKRGKPFVEEELQPIIKDIATSLEHIHEHGLLHRDVSPDNIMIDHSGKAKLIDFGATRQYALDETTDLSVVVKPGFAPVEQYSRTGKQGPWTDVYALAATYYYLLTGKKPLSAVERTTGSKMKTLRQQCPEASENTNRAIENALKLDYSQRTQSMHDFLKQLDAGYQGGQIPYIKMQIMGNRRKFRFLSGQRIRIGRECDCDICLMQADISRIHCELIYDMKSKQFVVTDCSSNGTYTKLGLIGKGRYAILKPGDSFYLVCPENWFDLEVK